MSALKRLGECRGFEPDWKLFVDGALVKGDWEVVSQRFGKVHSAVVCGHDGKPIFDRPAYREAENVNIVTWGKKGGVVRIAIIRQPRPHADDPEQENGVLQHNPVVFGSIPMGFMEKILGEDGVSAAKRETGEETGASVILNVTLPKYPFQNPNPTFVSTWSNLYFVEVDLDKIEALKVDHSEPIYTAEYIPVSELIRRVAAGKDEAGAVYRMCTTNALLFIFFCTHPELFQA